MSVCTCVHVCTFVCVYECMYACVFVCVHMYDETGKATMIEEKELFRDRRGMK